MNLLNRNALVIYFLGALCGWLHTPTLYGTLHGLAWGIGIMVFFWWTSGE